MSYLRRISIAFASGLANGFLFYVIGKVANSVITSIDPTVAFLVGFGSSVAIALNKTEKKNE